MRRYAPLNHEHDAPAATAWGSITGTLSDQTDLQTALAGTVKLTGDQTIAGLKTFTHGSFPPMVIRRTGTGGSEAWGSGITMETDASVGNGGTLWFTGSGNFSIRPLGVDRVTWDSAGVMTLGTVPWARLSGVPTFYSPGYNANDFSDWNAPGNGIRYTVGINVNPPPGADWASGLSLGTGGRLQLAGRYGHLFVRDLGYSTTWNQLAHLSAVLPLTGGTLTGGFSAPYIGVENTLSTTGYGLSLYGGETAGAPSYGIIFAGASTFGAHGDQSGTEWGTYFRMAGGSGTRAWVFSNATSSHVASIASTGTFTVSKSGSAAAFIKLDPTGLSSNYGMTIGHDDIGAYISHSSTIRGFRYIRAGTTHFSVSSAGAGYIAGTFDIGHASDTTLSRKAAGSLGVENRAAVVMANTGYTQSRITVSTSAPSGGVNGDIWLKV